MEKADPTQTGCLQGLVHHNSASNHQKKIFRRSVAKHEPSTSGMKSKEQKEREMKKKTL
jgi:hypothetical protein